MNELNVFSSELDNSKICKIIVNKNKNSEKIKEMQVAQSYFEGKNIEIEQKTRDYVDAKGNIHKNPSAPNTQLHSSFLRELIQQKQDYAFAKTFTFKLSTENNKEIDITTDDPVAKVYLQAWTDLIKDKMYSLVYDLAGVAINKGLNWCYVWIDENGDFQLAEVDPEHIYPIWVDTSHKRLSYLVNNFTVNYYDDDGEEDTQEYAEYWTDSLRILYKVSKDGYTEVPTLFDVDSNPIYSHMTQRGLPISWGKIPFLCLKGTTDEKPLLNFIKSYIDAYDILSSKGCDGTQDDIDPLLVFKGISAEVGHLAEARGIAKSTRTMSLDTDGDAFYLQAKTDIDSNLSLLEILRKNIIKFGYGVDFEDSRFGGNPNQMVVKALYQNMDTYVDGLERQFQNFINDLKYFFDLWLSWKGLVSLEDLKKYKILVKLDRSMMINLSALIDDAIKLAQTGISQKTIMEFNPVVQDVDLELSRIQSEQENSLFNFDNTEDTSDTEERDNSDTSLIG